MEIYLNGEPCQIADDINAAQLIEELALAGRRVAVEVNRDLARLAVEVDLPPRPSAPSPPGRT